MCSASLPVASFWARTRPASALWSVLARNTVGMPAAANTAPAADPIVLLAPTTTIFRIDLMERVPFAETAQQHLYRRSLDGNACLECRVRAALSQLLRTGAL